jgi:Uncharacterized conserved protein (DUF2190)
MAVSGGITETFNAGDRGFLILTCKAAGAITAGQVVVFTGNAGREVDVAGAGAILAKGVALQTASAAGDKIDVALPGGVVFMLKAAGAIDAGQYVESAAAGTVRVLATVDAVGSIDPRAVIGVALEDTADTVLCPVVVF